eukprot:6491742-Amphidinium_carterae.2
MLVALSRVLSKRLSDTVHVHLQSLGERPACRLQWVQRGNPPLQRGAHHRVALLSACSRCRSRVVSARAPCAGRLRRIDRLHGMMFEVCFFWSGIDTTCCASIHELGLEQQCNTALMLSGC